MSSNLDWNSTVILRVKSFPGQRCDLLLGILNLFLLNFPDYALVPEWKPLHSYHFLLSNQGFFHVESKFSVMI